MNLDVAPPRWATVLAWSAPIVCAPSVIWRVAHALRTTTDPVGSGYLLVLSLLQLCLSLLTVGLVQGWGLTYPRWIPMVGGKPVPTARAAALGWAGGTALVLLTLYIFFVMIVEPPYRFSPGIGADGPPQNHPGPGSRVLRYYIPLVFWGPIVLAVTTSYYRRTAQLRTERGR
ncbi:hypothetical protein ABZX12_26200 [Kribbella sp. NPDC003505]|uniref:hypothetical protein n=1 Tax=Kribbella sp. NPDC003505 TaxID=3154448 RepID=UPI0033A67045